MEERVQLDQIYELIRRALKDGISIWAIQEEVESAARAHLKIAKRIIAEHENKTS